MSADIKKIFYYISALILFPANFASADAKTLFNSSLVKTGDGAGYSEILKSREVTDWVGLAIQTALSFIGVIFLILIFYSGFIWMTARGDQAKVTKAKDTLISSVVGLIVIVAAYAVSYFVVQTLQASTLQ